MSMKLAKTIQFSICILKARTPLVEVSLSVPMSSLTSPMIGKNWQTINVIASAINMFISRSTLFPTSNKITLFKIDKMPNLYFCNGLNSIYWVLWLITLHSSVWHCLPVLLKHLHFSPRQKTQCNYHNPWNYFY